VIDEAASTCLAAFHAVVLANVYRIVEPAVESLERFARSGGGVMIFLGDQVDATAYRDTMYRGGEGLLPASPGEVAHPAEPVHLVIADRLHPALGEMGAGEDPLGLGQIPFFEFYPTQLSEPDNAPSDQAAGTPPPRITCRDVLLPYRARVRGGRVMLITTTADKEWNLWADHPTYLPVITELLRHLTANGGKRSDFQVGSPIELEVEPGVFESTVAVRMPGYPNEPEATTSIVADPNTQGCTDGANRIRGRINSSTPLDGIERFAWLR
jgi:hypothetical protein